MNEVFESKDLKSTLKLGQEGSVIIWGDISSVGVSKLVLIKNI